MLENLLMDFAGGGTPVASVNAEPSLIEVLLVYGLMILILLTIIIVTPIVWVRLYEKRKKQNSAEQKIGPMEIFAARLKGLRVEKGLAIQQISNELGISRSMFIKWESGKIGVTGSQLVVLAKYFNVSIDYLMGLEN